VRSGDTVESPSAGLLQMRQAEALFRGDFVAAVSFGEAAVEAARQADDRACRANMLALLYMAEVGLGADLERALTHAEQAVEVARPSPATSVLLHRLMILAVAFRSVDPDRALAAAEECIRLDRTNRKAWSTLCVGVEATVRLDRGEVA